MLSRFPRQKNKVCCLCWTTELDAAGRKLYWFYQATATFRCWMKSSAVRRCPRTRCYRWFCSFITSITEKNKFKKKLKKKKKCWAILKIQPCLRNPVNVLLTWQWSFSEEKLFTETCIKTYLSQAISSMMPGKCSPVSFLLENIVNPRAKTAWLCTQLSVLCASAFWWIGLSGLLSTMLKEM